MKEFIDVLIEGFDETICWPPAEEMPTDVKTVLTDPVKTKYKKSVNLCDVHITMDSQVVHGPHSKFRDLTVIDAAGDQVNVRLWSDMTTSS